MTSPAPRKYKPKVNIVVDTETGALDSKAAVYDIGAVVAWPIHLGASFSIKIKPSSYNGTAFEVNAETLQWHKDNKPGYLEQCEEEGVDFREAAQVFADWLQTYAANFDLHMWAQGKDFDQSVLGWLFNQCSIKQPYSYRNFHCTRDLLFLNPAARIRGGQDEAAHTALADAEWAASQLIAIINNSTWYQRLMT